MSVWDTAWNDAEAKAFADLAARWGIDLNGPGAWIVYDIVSGASSYWRSFDEKSPSDFMVQLVSDGAVIFGGWRRLRWSAATGYVPVETEANAGAFNAACRDIGPLPRRR